MISSKPSIYLAGGMEKAGEYGSIWREEITPHLESLGYTVWNPYKEELNVGIGPKGLADLKESNYSEFLKYCRKIIDYDIASLLKCAAVAVRIDASVLVGAGSYGELTFCHVHKIPVYAWIDLPRGKLDVPSWAMGCLTAYTCTQEDFYASIPVASNT